jgi:hypothetical protein
MHLWSLELRSAWAICVSDLTSGGRPALGKRGRVDYREVLADESRMELGSEEKCSGQRVKVVRGPRME